MASGGLPLVTGDELLVLLRDHELLQLARLRGSQPVFQAARDLGIEDEVDSILSGQGGQNSAVLQGFDAELGTAATDPDTPVDGAPDTTADFGDGANTLGDNDNDGGEGSPG